MRPARYTKEETRDMILTAADKLMSEYGFQKTTISDIARACGFSTANVHKFFGTKSAIKEAVAAQTLSGLLAEADEAARRADTPEAKLRAFVTSVHTGTLQHFREKKRVFESLGVASEEKWDAVRQYRLGLLARLESILQEGVDQEAFHTSDVKATALGMHMALFRVFHPAMVMESIGEPDCGSVETLLGVLLDAVRRNKGGPQ